MQDLHKFTYRLQNDGVVNPANNNIPQNGENITPNQANVTKHEDKNVIENIPVDNSGYSIKLVKSQRVKTL